MKLLQTTFWELAQNLFLVTGFMGAVELWQQGRWLPALLCMVGGSVAGALVIRFTESRIVAGHREPVRVVVANVLTMTFLMLVLTAYLSTGWSSWKLDLVAGALAGIVLGAVQDVVDRKMPSLKHCAAFAVAFPVALIGVRMLIYNLSLLWGVLVVSVLITLPIVVIDYDSVTSRENITVRS